MNSHTQLDITGNINGFHKFVFQSLAVMDILVEYLLLQDLFDKIKSALECDLSITVHLLSLLINAIIFMLSNMNNFKSNQDITSLQKSF